MVQKNKISEKEALENLKKIYVSSEKKILDDMKETKTSPEDLAFILNMSKEKFIDSFKPDNEDYGFYHEALKALEEIKENKMIS